MAKGDLTCPFCGFVVRAGKHPKDESIVEALPQMVGHLNSAHKREITELIMRQSSPE